MGRAVGAEYFRDGNVRLRGLVILLEESFVIFTFSRHFSWDRVISDNDLGLREGSTGTPLS